MRHVYLPKGPTLRRPIVLRRNALDRILSRILVLGMACAMCFGCGAPAHVAATSTITPAVAPYASPTPFAPAVFEIIRAPSISTSEIDAHIPRSTSAADRKVIRAVAAALPPSMRQNVIWLRVSTDDYFQDKLPNRGLVVEYCAVCGRFGKTASTGFRGNYILYFDGKVQLDSNLTFVGPPMVYFIPVMTTFRYEALRQPHS